MLLKGDKRAQVTIFIIVAIVLVAAVGIFFLIRNQTGVGNIPSEFNPFYESFSFCLENKVASGINALSSQGGYISLPSFSPGSDYMPFSSQLNFLGNPIPYWYYVSGNNLVKEQVPSKKDMEEQLNKFIELNIINCIPEELKGDFEISIGNPSVKTSIKSNEVQVSVNMNLGLSKGNQSVNINNHKVTINSDIGKLYDNAIIVYNSEKEDSFLENYGVDTLRLYAPVDGVEFKCSPNVWSADNIFNNLEDAIQENTLSLKTEGSSDDYFLVKSLNSKLSNGVYARFINSKNWSRRFEVNPSDGPLLIANSVGNQQGLGILGFCYVPYHFVYDVKYPVLIQLYSENTGELFQFPVAVIIEGNKPRGASASNAVIYQGPQICENKNTQLKVRTLDSNSNLINSEIYFECFGDSCKIGDSSNGVLNDLFPQCINGYIIAKAEGYVDSKIQIQNINPGNLEIFMDKLYEKNIRLNLDSNLYNGEATIIFEREGLSQSLIYPLQNKINLSEGSYNISVYVYENVSLTLGSSVQEYCTEIPRAFGGSFGLTKKECFSVEVPEQLITNALSGGGAGSYYFSESQLRGGSQILINSDKLPKPSSLNQLQENYLLFDSKNLEVSVL